MELNSKIIPLLTDINFCERYKLLSNKNQYADNNNTIEQETVLNLIKSFGYEAKFNKSESFYKIVQKQNEFKFQFNISLKYGNIELIWGVWHKENILEDACGPWGVIYKLVLNSDERPLMPKFRNYEDLAEILKEAFSIYEDFKIELLKQETA